MRRENRRPGGTGWRPTPGRTPATVGFADATSASCGQRVRLFTSTRATHFRVEAWRLGYYHGAGARLLWKSGSLVGYRQSPRQVDPTTGEVTAFWRSRTSFTVPGDWPPGAYLLRLKATTGTAGFIPLTIRAPAGSAALATFVNATATWQMYNAWGGYSAYHGPGLSPGRSRTRSRVVSYNRPYDGLGAGELLRYEYPLFRLMEQQGIDTDYVTSEDLDAGRIGAAPHVLVFGTHTEYVTTGARHTLEQALAGGVNLAFFGGNQVYWHPHYVLSAGQDRRQLVIYREAADDPHAHNPALATERWRDRTIGKPEQLLLGDQANESCLGVDGSVRVERNWLFAGTGLAPGRRIAHLAHQEVDAVGPGPRVPVVLLSRNVFPCPGSRSLTGQDIVVRAAPGGGAVFNAGTMGWVCELAAACPAVPHDLATQVAVRRMTLNVLRPMLLGPAGQLAKGQRTVPPAAGAHHTRRTAPVE